MPSIRQPTLQEHQDTSCITDLCVGTNYLSIESGEWRVHAKASRKIDRVGTVISRNPPLAHSLLVDLESTCAYCFAKPPKLFRCSKCQTLRYCGRECQSKDFAQHKWECAYRSKRNGCSGGRWEDSTAEQHHQELILLLRTYGELQQCKKRKRDQCTKIDDLVQCGSHHWDEMVLAPKNREQSLTYSSLASVLTDVLPNSWLNPQHIEGVLRRFQANNFGIVNAMHATIGQGVYPHGALLNHSCDPNCLLRYREGTTMEIVTLRPIEAGEELTHSYVDLMKYTEQRSLELRNVHGFQCQCKRCKGEITVSLPELHQSSKLHRSTASIADLYKWIVDRSNPYVDSSSVLSSEVVDLEVEAAMKVYNKPDRIIDELDQQAQAFRCAADYHRANDDVEQEASALGQLVCLLEKACYAPLSMELYQARGDYLSSLLLTGNLSEARRQCTAIVAVLCLVFPSYHPLIGLQLFTLGDLEGACGDDLQKQQNIYKWARDVLRVSHGTQHDLVQHLDAQLQ